MLSFVRKATVPQIVYIMAGVCECVCECPLTWEIVELKRGLQTFLDPFVHVAMTRGQPLA